MDWLKICDWKIQRANQCGLLNSHMANVADWMVEKRNRYSCWSLIAFIHVFPTFPIVCSDWLIDIASCFSLTIWHYQSHFEIKIRDLRLSVHSLRSQSDTNTGIPRPFPAADSTTQRLHPRSPRLQLHPHSTLPVFHSEQGKGKGNVVTKPTPSCYSITYVH